MFKKVRVTIGYFRFYLKKFLFQSKKINKFKSKYIDEIKENGYAVIPNYYDDKTCKELREKIDFYIDKYKDTDKVWNDDYDADHRLYSSEDFDDIFKKFHTDSFLQDMADNYFEAEMTNSNTLAARIDAKENNLGSGGGWHRDSNFFQFKSIIYLDDVSEENGPFQIFEKSHKYSNVVEDMEIMDSEPLSYRFNDNEIEKLEQVKGNSLRNMVAPAGTLLLVDTSAIHRGKPIEKGNRYTLFNYFIPSYYNKEKVLLELKKY